MKRLDQTCALRSRRAKSVVGGIVVSNFLSSVAPDKQGGGIAIKEDMKKKPARLLNKCSLIGLRSFLIVVSEVIFLTTLAYTVEAAQPVASNVGLMLNPPPALKARFPMCDVYLNVEWIDKEKRIGHTHYVTRMINDKGELEAEKKSAWALVNLEDSEPSYTLDIYPYVQQKRMGELLDLVRNGKPKKGPWHFAIVYKNKRRPVVFFDSLAPVFTNHEKTVCIVYPDGKKAWIIEAPNVKSKYSPEQIDALQKRLNFGDAPNARKALEHLWVLDINSDGLDDYIPDIYFGNRGFTAFSSPVGLQMPTRTEIDFGYALTSPVNGRVCPFSAGGDMKSGDSRPLTTDGKAYFFPSCNLTQFTTTTSKE